MFYKLVNYLVGFCILVLIQTLSNKILLMLNLKFPSPLLGMLILTFLLYFKIIPEKLLEDVSNILLKNMSLFFVPLFVGVICFAQLIQKNLLPIVAIIIGATFITMVLTALFVEFVIKLTKKDASNE